jgi:adenosylcobinamide kinase / adenosylcobinamide-phosphate guanylyltransferase
MAAGDARTFHRARAAGEAVSSILVLGGARSGKSRYAEGLGKGRKIYIATAHAFDDEMQDRISRHQQQRGTGWTTVEAPLDLVGALNVHDESEIFILVDCLTLWISNLLHAGKNVRAEVERLADFVSSAKARIAVVSNEVGQGIVPDNALARAFRDEQGFCNQRIAQAADEVVYMVAGLPMTLKKPARRAGSKRKAR